MPSNYDTKLSEEQYQQFIKLQQTQSQYSPALSTASNASGEDNDFMSEDVGSEGSVRGLE